jgi:hypothetical protein
VTKPCVWMFASAILATTGVAHAQNVTPAERSAVQAEVPWYERFTTSTGVTESITGTNEADRLPEPSWTLNQRWGVTMEFREGQQRIDRRLEGALEDQTAVGAYYQFTPRVRLGGEVSVGAAQRTPATPVGPRDEDAEASAGVRIESAFRF